VSTVCVTRVSSYRHLLILIAFTDPATPEIYALSLHDALPIFGHGDDGRGSQVPVQSRVHQQLREQFWSAPVAGRQRHRGGQCPRSEEHTSELQSRENLVCRLLLEKKKMMQFSLFRSVRVNSDM